MSTTETLTLADFLLARIAADETAATAASHGGRWRYAEGESVGAWSLYDEHWTIASITTYDTEAYDYSARMPAARNPGYIDADANGDHIARWDPARVLAECEAKRRIVALHTGWHLCPDGREADATVSDETDDHRLCLTLRLLALPDAGHPDYRDEWQP